MQPKRKVLAVTAAAVAVAAALGIAGGAYLPFSPATAATQPPVVRQAPAARALPDFSDLVEKYGPAVVNVSVTGKRQVAAQINPFGAEPGDPFYEFFRQFQAPGGEVPIQGQASGFMVSPDGYILTNVHVVADATEVIVKLSDQREFKARVVGQDIRTDVALIKIEASGLPTVKIGNPDATKVGQWVVAIGSPFGLDHTVTAGIVSAKSRSLSGAGFVPFIQTDVAINPGNSGGPLFNMDGEVIGINSQIYSRTGGYMGLSFAIPIDVAMKVKGDLQKYGKVTRGRLGVTVQSLTPDLAESFGLQKSQGALVNSVEPGSPAAKAGLAQGDVMLSVNGRTVDQAGDLSRLIADARPGSKVDIKIWRKGAIRELTASVGEAPSETVARAGGAPGTAQGRLGLSVRPLTSEEREQLGADGVVVENATGAAERAGIRPGDAILALNDQPVKNPEQLRKLVDSAKGNVALLIQREDSKIYVPIRIG
jgi:serine protease Do